jgi:hypothetical protein
MIRLFYVSTASLPFDEDDLEGGQSTVNALMDAIRSDDRHSGVVVIGQRPVTKRQWDGWSMRLVKGLAFDPLLASMSSD